MTGYATLPLPLSVSGGVGIGLGGGPGVHPPVIVPGEGGGPGTVIDTTPPTVATGDPGLLHGLSASLAGAGTSTLEQAGTIRGAAECLTPSWQGQAAESYSALSSLLHGAMVSAAGTMSAASRTLARLAHELERCQREGLHAVAECHTWAERLSHDNAALQRAITAAMQAQTALSTARAQLSAGQAKGASGAVEAAAAARAVADAQQRLTQAQGDERHARTMIHTDHDQLRSWQARGRRAWEEAQRAAEEATGSLLPLTVPPPPFIGEPAVQTLTASPPIAIPGCTARNEPGLLVNASGEGNGTGKAAAGATGALGALGLLLRELLGSAGDEAEQLLGRVGRGLEDSRGGSSARVDGPGVDRGDGRDALGRFTGRGGYGADAEAKGLQDYADQTGREAVATRVRARLPDSDQARYYDGLARKPDGTYEGVEVKSGNASRTGPQRTFDGKVSQTNPASATLNGQRITITSVRVIIVH